MQPCGEFPPRIENPPPPPPPRWWSPPASRSLGERAGSEQRPSLSGFSDTNCRPDPEGELAESSGDLSLEEILSH